MTTSEPQSCLSPVCPRPRDKQDFGGSGQGEIPVCPLSPLPPGGQTGSSPGGQSVPCLSPSLSPDQIFAPGTIWLITPRTAPAWTAVLHLLYDDQWHSLTDVADAMRTTANLAPTTIRHHLRSAGRRGWITTRRGRVKLRDRDLIETALDQLGGPA